MAHHAKSSDMSGKKPVHRHRRIEYGSHSREAFELMKRMYNYTCPCCGKREPEIKLTRDHIISVQDGGSSFIENIQPLCEECNQNKGKGFEYYPPSIVQFSYLKEREYARP